ncbi:UNKNOWN [Stylonychia lemnae]|uniref:Right handed beta helix domain-containing protein n=1 Tax=Stylonychia lemnae TaxID=5949 RepID=A0A078B770_STYLE|nr:UNKNOWN [Stylonychia lemnae]|eukprot:CDW90254.1 UNKNOWN [Stylonychia lemnae]
MDTPYNFNLRIQEGLLDQSAEAQAKYKFMTFNADLVVENFNFTEYSFIDSTINSLFFPKFGEYRWINITNCYFLLEQQLTMTLEGGNVKIDSSTIDVSIQNRVAIFQSSSSCYLFDNYGIANNYIWSNNLFIGYNVGGYTSLIYIQNHGNFTLINNRFIDMRWIQSDISISIEHIWLNCANIAYTQMIIQNNTIQNSYPTMSFIFFTFKFQKEGKQSVIIKDNKISNLTYFNPGVFVIQKFNQLDLDIVFENNYFENIENLFVETSFILVNSPNLAFKNNTIKNSVIPTFISVGIKLKKFNDMGSANIEYSYKFNQRQPNDSYGQQIYQFSINRGYYTH